MSEKIPQDLESERAVLGAVLLVPERTLPTVLTILQPADFSNPGHGAVWAAMVALDEKRVPIEPLTVTAKMDELGTAHYLGAASAGYLLELMNAVATVENVEYHARTVQRKAERRRWAILAQQLKSLALGDEADADFFRAGESLALKLSEQRRGVSLQGTKDGLRSLLKTVEERYSRHKAGKPVVAVRTGLTEFDELTHGLQPGQLCVLAARPGMGKSALAGNACQNAAHEGVGVLIFNLEMSKAEAWSRLVVSEGVSSTAIRTGDMTSADFQRLNVACSKLAEDNRIWIEDAAGSGQLTIAELRSIARRWRMREAKDLERCMVVVDYLQLVNGSDRRKDGTREQEIAEVSRGLKSLAKEIGCPVLALAQLNREAEKRANRRPGFSDLRESGQIEQDADVIAFLYRDEVYNANSDDKGIAELIVTKNRDGETATIKLAWDPARVRFRDLAPSHREPPKHWQGDR